MSMIPPSPMMPPPNQPQSGSQSSDSESPYIRNEIPPDPEKETQTLLSQIQNLLNWSSSGITQVLSSIRKVIYGDDVADPEIHEVDRVLDKISARLFNKDFRNYLDMLSTGIGDIIKDMDVSELNSVFSGLIFDPELRSRTSRYLLYEEIVNNITYCKRALKVLKNSIIAPDDVTKRCLQVTTDLQTSEERSQVESVRALIRAVNLEQILEEVIYCALLYGDAFVEFVDIESKDVPVTQVVLKEENLEEVPGVIEDITVPIEAKFIKLVDEDLVEKDERSSSDSDEKYLLEEYDNLPNTAAESDIKDYVIKNYKVRLEFCVTEDTNLKNIADSFSDETEKKTGLDKVEDELLKSLNVYDLVQRSDEVKEVKSRNKGKSASNIHLIVHSPYDVIKLATPQKKLCLGYLVLPPITGSQQTALRMSIYGRGISSSSGILGYRAVGYAARSGLIYNSMTLSGVDRLYDEILKKLKNVLKEDDFNLEKNELVSLLKRFISEIELENKQQSIINLKIRFVPVSRMEHFRVPPYNEFFPYGCSIFQNVIFQSKLFLALETAFTIKRLIDSMDRRVIYVEYEGLTRELTNTIQTILRNMNKKRFSLDTATISEIPSTVTTSQNIIIPVRRGKRMVEFDVLGSTGQIQDLANDLRVLRDTLVSGLEVPPAYLSIEENISNRALLSYENIIFASTVLNYQHNFSQNIRSLVNKIYTYINQENLRDYINVVLTPPRMIQLEKEAEKHELATRIVNNLASLGIDIDWLKKKYLDIDFEDLEKFEIEKKSKTTMTPPPPMMGPMPGGPTMM